MCSSCMVLKVTCPQSRVSSMSHGPWQRPLSLFRQYLQRGLLYLPCEQCLAISILQQSARSCLSLLLRICQARKQSMFRTMFDKAKKGTKCKLTKSPCWGCVSDRHKGCWGDSPWSRTKCRLILLLVPGACHIDTGLHFQSYQSYHNVTVSHKAQNYLIFLDLFRQFIKIQFQQHCTCVGWKHLISLMEKTWRTNNLKNIFLDTAAHWPISPSLFF